MYCTGLSFRLLSALRRTAGAGIDSRSLEHALQEGSRAGLVEELVEVAALRRLHAGGTTLLARTACEQPLGIRDPPLEDLEAALGDPDAAGMAVVDEHGWPARLEVHVGGEASDVPAIAHRPERQQRDQRVLGRVQAREQERHLLEPGELLVLGQEPHGLRLERRLRQVERDEIERRAVADGLALIGDDLLGDGDGSEGELEPKSPLRPVWAVDRRRRLLLRLRVPVARVR